MNQSHRGCRSSLCLILAGLCVLSSGSIGRAADPGAAARSLGDDGCDLVRKADLLHSPRWQRAVSELGSWLTTQTIYSPAEVQRIKVQFNDRVAAMSSYDLEYMLDSIAGKMHLLDTPEARDAKAWLGEYLSAMSDSRRAQALGNVPNILDMSAAQLWQEIQRIDTKRASLQQRQQGVESRQAALVDRAATGRQATSTASREAAARARAAPAHSPYRTGGGSPPFSDVAPRRASIQVGPFGAGIAL